MSKVKAKKKPAWKQSPPPDITITLYSHADAALWPLIGPHLTSRQVAKELGGQPFSDDSTVWWVATDKTGQVAGFAALKNTRGSYWEDGSYVLPDHRHKGIHRALCQARDEYRATLPPQPLQVCCRVTRWPHYEARGFEQQSVRGSWVYGKKPVAASQSQEVAK